MTEDNTVYISMTPIMPTGWICPRCGRVWGPHVDQCTCKPQTITTWPPYDTIDGATSTAGPTEYKIE